MRKEVTKNILISFLAVAADSVSLRADTSEEIKRTTERRPSTSKALEWAIFSPLENTQEVIWE